MAFWIVLIAFMLVVPAVIYAGVSMYKEHSQATGKIINYDAFMNKFVYKIPLTKAEILSKFSEQNNTGELSCILDLEISVIVLADLNSREEYFFHIQEQDGFSILQLETVHVFSMHQNRIGWKLNPFMVDKLHAQIVPFAQYGF